MTKEQEPIAARLRYHATTLDDYLEDDPDFETPLEEPTEHKPANVASSLCTDGKHRPALDIDIPCEFIPSSTPGHGHLYFPEMKLSWERYQELMTTLAAYGIVDKKWAAHSRRNGQSLVRLPTVKKIRKIRNREGGEGMTTQAELDVWSVRLDEMKIEELTREIEKLMSTTIT